MRKLITSTLVTLLMVTGAVAGTSEAATAKRAAPSYKAQVVGGTWSYRPCVQMRRTHAGRVMYWDMVADTVDEGHKRTVKAQISYVRQGCRNGS